MQRKTILALSTVCALTFGCSGTPQTLLSPSATTPTATFLNPDGSTMKMTAPRDLGPTGQVDTRRPTLGFTNAVGTLQQFSVPHEVEILDGNGTVVYSRDNIPATGSSSLHALESDLSFGDTYRFRARAKFNDQFGPWSAFATFRTPDPPPPPPPAPTPGVTPGGGTLPRTPDPSPGQRLPLPNMAHIVGQVAGQYPGPFFNSCQEHGGSWDFMDVLVDTLRTFDNRWGYNWKRGNVGDPSLDVIDYHFGAGPSEGSTAVYIIDVILGHCGNTPSPGWGDVTDATFQGGSIGRWTGRGRFTN